MLTQQRFNELRAQRDAARPWTIAARRDGAHNLGRELAAKSYSYTMMVKILAQDFMDLLDETPMCEHYHEACRRLLPGGLREVGECVSFVKGVREVYDAFIAQLADTSSAMAETPITAINRQIAGS
jgi:hypothetical protein